MHQCNGQLDICVATQLERPKGLKYSVKQAPTLLLYFYSSFTLVVVVVVADDDDDDDVDVNDYGYKCK